MAIPKISFEAFQTLFIKWQCWVQSVPAKPRTFEDWMLTWLDWLDYPPEAIKALKQKDTGVSAHLAKNYPVIFAPEFDADYYYRQMFEEIAEAAGRPVAEVRRALLTLVK